ncbi:glutathione S-transferase [Vigna unguiculata]|uniref:Glutathione S-transferase n=1 Tax=Vigna unguiculata TaxID=3917 RepID=A0A4D6N4E2_VIGUN|nr:glutathione S-transferase [Vigna unguiculata]
MGEVKLHGFWYSPFALRVKWSLKLKGIEYENIEEDRFNKSSQLVQYNPVYKRIPILVHAGKPISESMLIIEYIDQVWPQNPLLPSHPYHRALARFWVKYSDDLTEGVRALYRSKNNEQRKKAIEDILEHLRVVEDQCLGKENKFFGGDCVNVVDLAFGSIIKYLTVLEDILEVQILEAQKFPRLYSWFNIFKSEPAIAEILPDQDQMVAFVKPLREQILASS